MNLEPELRASHCITDEAESRQGHPKQSSLSQPKSCIGHSTLSFIREYNSRAKDYVPKVLPSLQPINLSSDHCNSKRLLKRISEEFVPESANGMMLVDHGDYRQGSSPNMPRGPQYYEVNFDEDDEDEYELLLDERLARDGLYRGNYRNLVLLHTVVPLTTLFSFICLALVPTLVFTADKPSRFPYPPYLPFPILEVVTATALWSLSYLLRDFLYATALFIAPSSTIITTILSATLQTTSNLLLRQIAIPILLIPYYSSKPIPQEYPTWEDNTFKRVWWVALGWAAAEAVVGVKQGYESIALYKDVLVNVNLSIPNTEMGTRGRSRQDSETPRTRNRDEREDMEATPTQINWENQRHWLNEDLTSSPLQHTRYSPSLSNYMPAEGGPSRITDEHQPLLRRLKRPNDESEWLQAENDVERDLDQLLALKNREELEEAYGIPVIRIPVFISCLHRINSLLSSLGIYLLLTSAYMHSTLAILTPIPSPTPLNPLFKPGQILSSQPPHQHLALTTVPILIIYTLLAITHSPLILPRMGIHTFVYLELLVSLGVLFGGLAVWGALS